jgi:ribosomal protein S18 acetylase RimI-like enzyme
VIRAARDGDAEAVAALITAINGLGDDIPDPPMSAAIVRRDLLGPQPKAMLFVAEWEREVVGFATAGTVYDAVRAAWALMLLDLYVAPEARRRGLARGLMARLAREAHSLGARCLWWGVDEGDDGAMLFYRAIGARSEGMFSGEIIDGAALDRLAAT